MNFSPHVSLICNHNEQLSCERECQLLRLITTEIIACGWNVAARCNRPSGGQTAMPKTPLKSTVDSDGNTTDFRRRQGEKPQHRRTDKMTNAGREAVQNTDAQFQPNRKLNWTRNRHPCSGLCGARQRGSGVFTGDRSVPITDRRVTRPAMEWTSPGDSWTQSATFPCCRIGTETPGPAAFPSCVHARHG